jgi:transposase
MSRVGEEIEDVLLLSLTGLESQNSQEDVVVQGSGLWSVARLMAIATNWRG